MATRYAILVAALSAGLVTATPADAQQRSQHWVYSQYDGNDRYDRRDYDRRGYDYGYRGDVRQLHRQIAQMRRDIHNFDRRGMISRKEARKLDRQAKKLEHKIVHMARYGMSHGEWRSAQNGIRRLEREIARDLRARGSGRDDRRKRHYRGDGWERDHDRWHDRNERHRRDHHDRWDD